MRLWKKNCVTVNSTVGIRLFIFLFSVSVSIAVLPSGLMNTYMVLGEGL